MPRKSDKIEKANRLRVVQEWILQDHLTGDIVSQCIAKWGISERQALRYLKTAHDSFAKLTEKNLERRLNYHIQRRNKLLRDLEEKHRKTPAGISTQLAILEDIAKLEQLYKLKIDLGIGGMKDGPAVQTESTHRVIFEKYDPH